MRAAKVVTHLVEHTSAGLIGPIRRSGVAGTSGSPMITCLHTHKPTIMVGIDISAAQPASGQDSDTTLIIGDAASRAHHCMVVSVTRPRPKSHSVWWRRVRAHTHAHSPRARHRQRWMRAAVLVVQIVVHISASGSDRLCMY